jgi:hypothetical protein
MAGRLGAESPERERFGRAERARAGENHLIGLIVCFFLGAARLILPRLRDRIFDGLGIEDDFRYDRAD